MSDLRETALYWLYRASDFLLANLLDDPAFVALVFC